MDQTGDNSWNYDGLCRELEAFRSELEAAGLRHNTVETYVGRATIFVRWLNGDYRPQGPVN